jgi:hypothetical protein
MKVWSKCSEKNPKEQKLEEGASGVRRIGKRRQRTHSWIKTLEANVYGWSRIHCRPNTMNDKRVRGGEESSRLAVRGNPRGANLERGSGARRRHEIG